MENVRLNSLRQAMKKNSIDVYYFNTSDYHMSEYVPEYFKTIRYFSGFTGSLATLLVSKDEAYIFVDGRYHGQADKQCLKNDVKVVKLGTKDALEPVDLILTKYPNCKLGLDGKRISGKFAKELLSKKIDFVSVDLYSTIIEERTPLGKDKIYALKQEFTGVSTSQKLELVRHCLGEHCHIVSNLESIAYILNLRSNDILYTPVFMSYLVYLDNDFYLFVDASRIEDEAKQMLNDAGVIIKDYDSFYDFLSLISGKQVVIDEDKVNYEIYQSIHSQNRIINKRSVIEEMKAVKNPVEQANSKLAHIYDGVSLLRFLMWLDKTDLTTIDEYIAARKIDEIRLSNKAFDLSFSSIVSYNENAAINHYSPEEDDCKKLANSGVLLFDTGGQYLYGTTDVTRTIALGEVEPEVKKAFTLVLKSMFNISELKFMKGLNGYQLDVLARQELWSQGWNFRHGTGHGVGHVLSVHEGPPNIRNAHTSAGSENEEFIEGMIVSDEPGVYFDNRWGIRCENLILCKKDYENEFGEFMKFETLTMCPFDLNLIDMNYMDDKTIKALNVYHQTVYNTLLPYLNDEEKDFLRKLTRPL